MGSSRSTTSRASANCGARATSSPSRVDDERVAVEHELVLAADHVDVGERAAGLARASGAQREPDVVLVALVRRAVDDDEQTGAGGAHLRDRSAVLPEVLADGEGDVDAVDAHDRGARAGDEVAVLVEDAVVGQVVLGVAGDDASAVEDGGGVLRRAARAAEAVVGVGDAVEVADHHDQPTEALGLEPGGEGVERGAARVLERRPQREVLDRVAGEHHLGERDEVGTRRRRLVRPGHDQVRVAREVADGRVDLGEGEPQLRHDASLAAAPPELESMPYVRADIRM